MASSTNAGVDSSRQGLAALSRTRRVLLAQQAAGPVMIYAAVMLGRLQVVCSTVPGEGRAWILCPVSACSAVQHAARQPFPSRCTVHPHLTLCRTQTLAASCLGAPALRAAWQVHRMPRRPPPSSVRGMPI